MSVNSGGFVWYELMTGDVEAASAFYAAVAGWRIEGAGVPGMNYRIAKTGEYRVAGLTGWPEGDETRPPMWFGYILVEDVDAAAKRLREAGGAVHREPVDLPGVGRFAIVADPQGAGFMLFKGVGDAPPEPAANTPGTIGWHELHTTDWKAAFAFYRELFGWQESVANDMGPFGIYQTFSVAGTWTGGLMNGGGSPEPHWLYYINVDDVDAAASRITDAGGHVVHGPHQVPGGSWVIMGKDPQGADFAVTGARRT